jgi:uncharacterized membrane protein YhaH (DUF805 family)
MNFIEAVKKAFSNYANFNGRARRSEYWWFFLFNLIVSIVLMFVDTSMGSTAGMLGNIYTLGTLVPSIAVGVRRMHDVGKSGWYLLIPIYNIILAATNGETGTNGYGADPKGDELEEDLNAIGKTS